MCRAPSAADLNRRLRQLLLTRNHRPLTDNELHDYRQLLTEWTAADQHERMSRTDVVEVA